MAESITRGGEIYFIRERDYITGEVSPYVKIGLTRDDRVSAARQGDHQTGNPRELFLHHAEKVDMVQTVEKTLHWQFAAKRVTGEWFLLDDVLLAEAVTKCQTLGLEFQSHVDAICAAEQLAGVPSHGEPIAASTEALEWWRKHQVADQIVSLCDDAVAKYKDLLKSEIQDGKDVGTAAKPSAQSKPYFDEKGFREKYPEMWRAHLGPSSVGGTFRVTAMKESELLVNPEVAAEISIIETFESSIGEYVRKRITLDQLSKGYIEFLSRTEYHRTRELLAKHYLMSICGDTPGIIGVCKWERTEKLGKLDRTTLRDAAPDKFGEFLTTKQVNVVNLNRKAGAAAADDA